MLSLHIINLLVLLIKLILKVLRSHLINLPLSVDSNAPGSWRETSKTAIVWSFELDLHLFHLLGHILDGLSEVVDDGFALVSLFVHFDQGTAWDLRVESPHVLGWVYGVLVTHICSGDLEVRVDVWKLWEALGHVGVWGQVFYFVQEVKLVEFFVVAPLLNKVLVDLNKSFLKP